MHARAPFERVVTLCEAIRRTEYGLTSLYWALDNRRNVPTMIERIENLCRFIEALRTAVDEVYPSARAHYGKMAGIVVLASLVAGAVLVAALTLRESTPVRIASVSVGTMVSGGALLTLITLLRDRRSIVEVSRAVAALEKIAVSLERHVSAIGGIAGHDGPVVARETTALLGRRDMPANDAAAPTEQRPPHPMFLA